MIELWSLMDTPMEEQQMYEHVTCNIAASEDEITAPSSLSLETIEQVKLFSYLFSGVLDGIVAAEIQTVMCSHQIDFKQRTKQWL
jgi:hypothetical protein